MRHSAQACTLTKRSQKCTHGSAWRGAVTAGGRDVGLREGGRLAAGGHAGRDREAITGARSAELAAVERRRRTRSCCHPTTPPWPFCPSSRGSRCVRRRGLHTVRPRCASLDLATLSLGDRSPRRGPNPTPSNHFPRTQDVDFRALVRSRSSSTTRLRAGSSQADFRHAEVDVEVGGALVYKR